MMHTPKIHTDARAIFTKMELDGRFFSSLKCSSRRMKRRTSRAQTAVTTTDDHGGDGRRDPVAVYECLDILLKLAHTVIVSRIGARELNRLVTDEACRTRSRRCGHRFAADRSTRPCSLYQEGGFCGRDRSRLPKHDAVSTARGGNIDQTLVGRTAPCKVERVARLHEGAVHKHVGGIQQAGGAGRINMRQHRRDVAADCGAWLASGAPGSDCDERAANCS